MSRFVIKSILRLGMLALLIVASPELKAQDSLKKWKYLVEPYMMFPGMVGETGVAGLPLAEVDASASDIFSNLQIGFMLNVEANNGTWAINSDLLFMNLKHDLRASTFINGGKLNAKQLGWEVAALRRVAPWLEFGVGGLLNSMQIEMNIDQKQIGGGSVNKTASQSKTWLDPMLITRVSTSRNKKLFAQLRAEIGGFGIGSDLAWQIQGVAGYQFSKLFDVSLGYRVISLDYTSGDGNKAFVYDMTTSGPMVKFGFNF